MTVATIEMILTETAMLIGTDMATLAETGKGIIQEVDGTIIEGIIAEEISWTCVFLPWAEKIICFVL